MHGNIKMTEEARLGGGNYGEVGFRTPPSHQNRSCQVDGENNSSENGMTIYGCAEFDDYLGNVGVLYPYEHGDLRPKKGQSRLFECVYYIFLL